MKIKRFISLGIMIYSVLILFSCENDDNDEYGENEVKISSFNDDDSHKNGQNCMSCHTSGGKGEGWFNVAGSVYDSSKQNPYPNAVVKLFSEPNESGSLIKLIEVDGNGNFYTTESINFGNGLYVSVTDKNGNSKVMNAPISTGQCNSCHGVNFDNIWVGK
jgi:hypothetical protein